MKFNLYLELGSRMQDVRILDLLRFPSELAFGGEVEWSARWWSHGKTRRMRAKQRESILSKLAEDGFNELELKCKNAPASGPETQIADAWLLCYPSPTSDLWAAVPSARVQSHMEERKRLSFGGGKPLREEYSEKHRLPYPSVVEYMLGIETGEKTETDTALQQIAIERFRATIPAALAESSIFGYGCVHANCRKEMMLHSLGGVAAWTDQLGAKFENIYPILIGPLAACEGLATALGDRGSLVRIAEHSPTAIVSIPPETVETVRLDPAVKEWVIIRDVSDLSLSPEVADDYFRSKSAVPWIAPFVRR